CNLEGPESVCENTQNTYAVTGGIVAGTVYQWSIIDSNGDPVPSTVASFVGATDGSSVVVKAGASVATYIVRLVKFEPGICPTACQAETNIELCAKPYCTYTQGYFGNVGGIACTPDGSKTTTQLITGSLANMPGGQLRLGVTGRSFTATNAADIIRIMPGGGPANRLPAGDHTPSSNAILKKGKISNVLLSQTIALALNTYMTGSSLASLSLAEGVGSADKYLVTVAKQSGSCSSLSSAASAECTYAPVYCSDGVTISGYTTVYNPYKSWRISSKVINALSGSRTVLDLLNLASGALGGTLPSGVTHSEIASAVAAINEAFDECRLFVAITPNASVSNYCTPPAGTVCPAPAITGRAGSATQAASNVEVKEVAINAYPNPFREQLNFRFVSPFSGKAILEVFNAHGQRLGVAFEGNVSAGAQNFARFNNHGAAPGMLIYKLSVGDQVLTGKVQSVK
ncbi:MAG: T9SS type A sorting domain-containing protein, partial [Bacteroidota bacterium]